MQILLVEAKKQNKGSISASKEQLAGTISALDC
jgi:hypothetical protein